MIAVVNDQHKYIMFYSAKVACTSMRVLYLSIHAEELSQTQRENLNKYHNLNAIAPFNPQQRYSSYYKFLITRNPYARVVSAFIDQYAYAKNAGVVAMLEAYPPAGSEPTTFQEFLEYLHQVPDEHRDTHFRTQSYFEFAQGIVTRRDWKYRWFGRPPAWHIGIDYDGDISDFNAHMTSAYQKIFKSDKNRQAEVLRKIAELQKRNSSFYGAEDYADAAQLTVEQINELKFAPKPQDFYNSSQARELVRDIYADDFDNFGYSADDIPQKPASKEIKAVPHDMDWPMYLRLNPDLPPDRIYNERTVLRHYLEFGQFEEHPRAYKIETPEGFDWRRYLSLHSDLASAGINTETAAIEHYLSFGIREGREI